MPHREAFLKFYLFLLCPTIALEKSTLKPPKLPPTLQSLWPFLCSLHPYFLLYRLVSGFCLLSLTFNWYLNSSLYKGSRN